MWFFLRYLLMSFLATKKREKACNSNSTYSGLVSESDCWCIHACAYVFLCARAGPIHSNNTLKIYFLVCPIWLPISFYIEPELGAGIDPDIMALTSFPSSIFDERRFELTNFWSWVELAIPYRTDALIQMQYLTILRGTE